MIPVIDGHFVSLQKSELLNNKAERLGWTEYGI